MRELAVQPTGVERTFGTDEVIVSKTDTKGRITYANQVFLRVSAFAEDDLIGQPHNVIRHPEMPRAVFKLLWDTLGAGKEIFAYINNLAADGAHYWVLAHVTPTRHGGTVTGYHSNRRVPDRAAVTRAEVLYRQMCTAEARHARPADAIAASTAVLEDHLARAGQTYDEWVWSLIRSGAAR